MLNSTGYRIGAIILRVSFRSGFCRQGVDLAGGKASAKTIVNVYHRHTATATVEHPKQRRQTAKAGPVTNAGRDGDDRTKKKMWHPSETMFAARYSHHVVCVMALPCCVPKIEGMYEPRYGQMAAWSGRRRGIACFSMLSTGVQCRSVHTWCRHHTRTSLHASHMIEDVALRCLCLCHVPQVASPTRPRLYRASGGCLTRTNVGHCGFSKKN